MTGFRDVLDELSGDTLQVEAEEGANREETLEESNAVPEQESNAQTEPPAEEEPEGEPTPEDATEPTEELGPTVEIDGEQVPVSKLREWKLSGMRQEDYTRKTQEASDLKRKAQEERVSLSKLAEDISDDPALQVFIAARPDALRYLMKEPEATRSLIGNPKAVEEFWTDYDAIRDNPRLAEKFTSKEPSEAEKDLHQSREVESMYKVVGALDQAVDAIGKEIYPDVPVNEVKQFVANLAGLPDNPTVEDQISGVTRLFSLFFENLDGNVTLNPRLLATEFQRVRAMRGGVEASGADEHNRSVDEALKNQSRPPKTPGGSPPVATTKSPVYKSFREAIDDILGG